MGATSSLDILKSVRGELLTQDTRSGKAPDFLAATYPIAVKSVTGSVEISFQRAVSFDGDRTIDTVAAPLQLLTTTGGFDVVALGTGLQVSRQVRVGLTLNRWLNGYESTQDRLPSPIRGRRLTTLDFSISGWNVNLGLIWSPSDKLNIGAVYKSGFTADADLTRSRTDFNLDGTVSTASGSSSDVRLDVPAAYGLGMSWRPTAPFTVSADYTHTNWSKGRVYNYFTLTPAVQAFPVLYYPTLVTDPAQRDTEQFRVGLEYVVVKGRLKWPLRIGYFADRQLFQTFDSATEQTDKSPPVYNGFTAGTGLVIGRLLVDVAYLYEYGGNFQEEVVGVPNDVKVKAHRFFVSLIYRHKR